MPHRMLALLAVGVLALISCEDPLAVSDCPAEVQLSVTPGMTPEFDWTPRCHLVGLVVTSTYERSTVWDIGGPQRGVCGDDGQTCYWRNTLYPPIRYGVVPRDVQQFYPPSQKPPPLKDGWPYEVRISRAPALPRQPHMAVASFVPKATAGTSP